MKRIKIIYDITVLGLHIPHENFKTGVYRVIEDLLAQMIKNRNIDMQFSHINDIKYLVYSQQYLAKFGRKEKLLNYELKLPDSIFGRAHGPVARIYKKLNLPLNKILYKRKFNKADVFHSTFYPIPSEVKNYENLKRVITIYDLIPILFPELHPMREQITKTVESIGSDYAICISEHTKRDLLAYDKNIKPENVFVSLLAASPENFYPCTDENKFNQVKEKYNLPNKYFLSLSTLEPRKNIEHVIRNFIKLIIEKKIDDLGLVLVGTKGWMFEKIFEEYENADHLKEKIVITGRIPDEDLASIYSNAHSFYYMSLYEGFGLPPLEAMQCGVATVSSNTSSLPEVMGDAGIMLDPLDNEALQATMWKLYYDEEFRQVQRVKALEQAKKFSWEKCAQDHIEIYEKIKMM